jgi:hypothetical protein
MPGLPLDPAPLDGEEPDEDAEELSGVAESVLEPDEQLAIA